jgi:hypothetical protein
VTDRAALLDYADQLLDGSLDLGARSARVAAVLARSAFEDWLDEQCPWAVTAAVRASAASKLAVFDALDDAGRGATAKRVWHGLSRMCHHHSYELQPSPAEVRLLVSALRQLDGPPRR